MEEYLWISMAARDPVFGGPSRPMLLRLADHFNVDISISSPAPDDTDSCIREIRDGIQRGVRGLMLAGRGDDAVISAVDAAVEHGIPVICVDRDISRSKRLAFVGADWSLMGSAMADNAGIAADSLRQQIAGYRGIELIAVPGQPAMAANPTVSDFTTMLREYGDLSGIAVFDESCGSAVVNALARLKRVDPVRVVCVDADAPRFKLVRSGAIDAAFYRKAEVATYLAIQYFRQYRYRFRCGYPQQCRFV